MEKAVIFDMDGVLVDSEPLYYKADQKMFANLGVPFTQEDVQGLAGVNSRSGAIGILKRHPELTCTVDELDEIYRASLLNALKTSSELCLIPGVFEWIKQLHEDGYRIAVASSSTAPMVAYVMERFGLDRIMDAVINGEMVRVAKPDPEIFLLAAKKIGVLPQYCTVIEDSTFGIRAAKAAGMRCLAYTGTNIHHLNNSEADDRFETYCMENYKKYFCKSKYGDDKLC